MLNFHKSSFLALELPKSETQFHGIRVKLCFVQNFQGQSDKAKNVMFFFQKRVSSNHSVWIFSRIAQ